MSEWGLSLLSEKDKEELEKKDRPSKKEAPDGLGDEKSNM